MSLALLNGKSISLTAIITAFAALIAAWVFLVSCFVQLPLFAFLFLRLPHVSLPDFYFLVYLGCTFFPFTSDTIQCYSHSRKIAPLVPSNYVIYCMCLAWLWYLTIYVQACIYIQLLHVKMAWWHVSMFIIGYYACDMPLPWCALAVMYSYVDIAK